MNCPSTKHFTQKPSPCFRIRIVTHPHKKAVVPAKPQTKSMCSNTKKMKYNHTWHKEHKKELQSPQWQQRRQQYIQKHGYHCQKCGKQQDLELHHLEYTHETGTEPDHHLMLLCDECHNHAHADLHLNQKQPTQETKECPNCTKLNKKNERTCQKCHKII